MWMLFLSLLCATASAFQHSHLAKDVEVYVTNCMNNSTVMFCRSGRDAYFTIVCILCADHVFWCPWFLGQEFNSFVPFFGLHANIVEEYVLLSALLHDQSCLHVFSISLCGFLFLEPLFARVGVLFMYMGARESCLRACATLLCQARVKTIGTSLCLTSSSLIVSATITERS